MGDLVGGPRRIAEVVDQLLHRRVAWRDEIDRLHRRQRLALLVDVLNQGDALGADVVHLAARRHHPHRELIHYQNPPFYPTCRLLLLLDHLVHNLCDVREFVQNDKFFIGIANLKARGTTLSIRYLRSERFNRGSKLIIYLERDEIKIEYNRDVTVDFIS